MPFERGISPEILLGLVENTAPWLKRDRQPQAPYSRPILQAMDGKKHFSHFEYFELCLSAHYSTVATFVPTDVDNQIRKNLWHPELELEVSEKMAALVLESLQWNFRPVTARYQEWEGIYVCGHQGEWFSVAVGAYAFHRERRPDLASEIVRRILGEVQAEAALFAGLKKSRDGIGLLKASTAIAHNLGDLDRVIDQWDLPLDDALRVAAFKLGHEAKPGLAWQGSLLEAGALNKAFMASENHRHYPLRKPKCLRRSLEFLLPLGPFFDAWGETVASSALIDQREKVEVAEALLDGFGKLSSPRVPLYGYARALIGMQRGYRGLVEEMSSKNRKLMHKGLIPDINRLDARAFEGAWAKKALGFL